MPAATLRESTNAQVQRLQAEFEAVVRDTLAPTLADIAARAVGSAVSGSNQVRSNQVREYSDTVAVGIRSRPLISVFAAAAIGFFAGRLTAAMK